MARLVGDEFEKTNLLGHVLLAADWDTAKPEYLPFKAEFPAVLSYAQRLKRKDFGDLSRMLQRFESHLVTRVVAGLVPWLVTLHDAILIEPADEEAARAAFSLAFGQMGVSPTVRNKGPA